MGNTLDCLSCCRKESMSSDDPSSGLKESLYSDYKLKRPGERMSDFDKFPKQDEENKREVKKKKVAFEQHINNDHE